jgi:glycosyltransferase involved in cell wall biosynthesis
VRVAHLKYRDTIPQFIELDKPAPKIVTMMRVKNESRWIDRVVQSVRALGPVYVMDDGSTDDTGLTAAECGAHVLSSPFIGGELDERRDKNWLLDTVIDLERPDWILCIDGDEELEPNGPAKILETLKYATADAYALRFAHCWDRPDQIRVDRWYQNFSRLSLFRPLPHLRFVSLYERSGVKCHSGLHTGNAPLAGHHGSLTVSDVLNVFLVHYGYMDKATRLRKFEYYNRIDPNNMEEDGYRHTVQGDLSGIPSDAKLKHAGPMQFASLPESMLRRPLVAPLVNVTPEQVPVLGFGITI